MRAKSEIIEHFMTQYSIHKKSKKAFLRWCAKGDEEYQNAISYALDSLLPMAEQAGFEWIDKTPDGYKNPYFYVEMSRFTEHGYECVSFNFNKYKKLKFSISFTVSDPSADYVRTVIGQLVPRKKENYSQHWWGASLISFNKQKAFKKDVDKVAKLLPQVIDFFTVGTIGQNIWVSDN